MGRDGAAKLEMKLIKQSYHRHEYRYGKNIEQNKLLTGMNKRKTAYRTLWDHLDETYPAGEFEHR